VKAAAWLLLSVLPAAAQVSYERLRRAESEPGSWLTYSGNFLGHRYSALDQINPGNVGRLRVAWIYQVNDLNKFETTPLVADGVMYITEPPSNATALDLRTGRPLWQYRRELPRDIRPCCGQVNRGAAILGDLVYLGTLDAHLVALDARTGRVRWDVEVADYKLAHTITGAPLAIRDKIVVGMAGGEFGVRGFLDAYDGRTGQRLWRFWTVPGPGEPGNETWAGESWKYGAATTWVTGSYDPENNLVLWGTGNPGPDYNGEVRRGDNLYAASLVAVDGDTGKLRWHFQFTPHDVHDWDSNQVPVIAGQHVVTANRNGFYYVLDRRTGRFLRGVPYAKQTWAKGLDDKGRPIRIPNTFPTVEGTAVYPSLHGGTNWFSPSYSPQTGLFYVAVREEGTLFYTGEAKYTPGGIYTGGSIRGIPGVEPSGSVKALEVETGKLRWEFPLQSPPWAGLLSTAGGLVFGGANEGYLFALDARTGKPLWRLQAGGAVLSNPISYLSDGKQHVAVAAGRALVVLALPD
jgi:alcohol dehydrogenase (cytochrome c)